MTWQHLFDLARILNLGLSPIALGAIGYRAVIGWSEKSIVYWPLFLIFVGYVAGATLGTAQGYVLGNRTGPVTTLYTALHLSLIYFCVFRPGPLARKAA